MSDTSETTRPSSTVPWLLGAIFIGVISAGLAFVTTEAVAFAVVAGAVVFICLWIGWSAAQTTLANQVASAPEPNLQNLNAARLSTGFALRAIEATPNPVLIIAAGGTIIASNHAARKRFSLTPSQTKFSLAVRRPDLVEAIEDVFRTGETLTFVIETSVPIDRFERISIAKFEDGETDFVLLAVQDETEIRLSERMRADFLANASHELRTPLAAIIGFIETLRGPAKDDEVARIKFLEVMHAQADRMSRLISDLLSLSRIELNERVPPTDLTNITATIFEAVDGLTPEKKKRVVLPPSQAPVWILGSRDEMAQVLSNLIDNALKYSGSEDQISIALTPTQPRNDAVNLAMRQWENASRLPLTSPPIEADAHYVVVRIEDKGGGIDRRHLPRLAERFFRVEDTASGKSGTGLGLAIVKHIISRHRGGLLVESELGKGTAFAIYLPEPRPTEPDEAAAQPSS